MTSLERGAMMTDGNPARANLAGIVRDRKVAIFLNEDRSLLAAIKDAGAREIAIFGSAGEQPGSHEIYRKYTGIDDVSQNNADVILLNRSSLIAARSRKFRYFRNAKHILVPVNSVGLLFSPLLAWHVNRKRLAFKGRVTIGPSQWFHFENVSRKHVPGPRFYVSTDGGAESIFRPLEGLNYCVMRSHDLLADLTQLNDIDLLIDNADVEDLKSRLTHRLGFFPVEIYTVFGAPGHSLREEAYFPPLRALELLSRSVKGRFGEMRPQPRDALTGYCYDLLFHAKPILHPRPLAALGENTWSRARYYRQLVRLAEEAGVKPFATLDDMVSYLRDEGWFPPEETLKMIARAVPFVRENYVAKRPRYRPGLTVFIMREVAQKYDLIPAIEASIAKLGFEILRSAPIPDDLKLRIKAEFRGGNWSTPRTSIEPDGDPIHFVVALDRHPIPVTDAKLRRRYPEGDNQRMLGKDALRRKMASLAGAPSIITFHSTDNSREALAYLPILAPDLHDACRERIASSNEA